MIPGGWELVAILAVLVLLFGASKLPGAARSIGQSMRIFKAETKGMRSDDESSPPPANPAPPVLPPGTGQSGSAQPGPTQADQSQRNPDTR